MTHDEIVDDYLKKYAPLLDREICYFKEQPSVIEAINKAAMAEMSSGKRSSHQPYYKFFDTEMEEARLHLLAKEKQIHTCRDFDEIHEVVGEAIGIVYKKAVLYVYDTSWKIGANLGIEPDRVYIHAGTRVGVKALGLNSRREIIEVTEFPTPLHRLRPIHIENFLCIYKKCLSGQCNSDQLPRQGCSPSS